MSSAATGPTSAGSTTSIRTHPVTDVGPSVTWYSTYAVSAIEDENTKEPAAKSGRTVWCAA